MKVSTRWLKEFVPVRADAVKIAERLTLAGVEAGVVELGALPDTVVVGRITDLQPHPQADRLRVATVEAGLKAPLTIVCGAPNARTGMAAPLALVGAVLPDGTAIKKASLRGVESHGMLCSARELGLAEKSEGLLELDAAAPVGKPVGSYLGIPDALLNLELTPNRGDCLSVAGLAREVSAIFGIPVRARAAAAVKPSGTSRIGVAIDSRTDCPAYAGRLVEGIDAGARTPDWMRERLRRADIRCIHPLVDITNYVMLELGQPMHAFDAARLTGNVRVRRARAGEELVLLNEQSLALSAEDLLIADDKGALALAGVMGGLASMVAESTTSVFLESACFDPERVAFTGRRLKIQSDALYRFERGVDPGLQRAALERATELVLQVCGGRAGPVSYAGQRTPRAPGVRLRRSQLDRLVGHAIPDKDVEGALKRLGLRVKRAAGKAWTVTVPSHRYDLRIEADIIEEVARLYGYDRIPPRNYTVQLSGFSATELQRSLPVAGEALVARGYQESMTYSFVERELQENLNPGARAIALDNPMADTQAVMRTTLWTGMLPALRYNLQRQHGRVRLFESGTCFEEVKGEVLETVRLAGVAAGTAAPEQWGLPARPVDFFDIKSDVEALLGGDLGECRFESNQHPALHPGQSARILRGDRELGWVGILHPRWARRLDLAHPPAMFELDWQVLRARALPSPKPPSEFPSARRDLAVVVEENLSVSRLLQGIRQAAGPLLVDLKVFDLYRGTGLPNGFKSVAFGLIFQEKSRTLTDSEVDAAARAVADALGRQFGASLRGSNRGGTDQSGVGGSAV